MLKTNHGPGRRVTGMLLAGSVALAGLAISSPAAAVQEKAEETKEFVKRIEIHEKGDKDVIRRHGDGDRMARVLANCDGEKFEAGAEGGTDAKKDKIKFFVCAKKGESLLPALEKAASRIEQESEIPAERKTEILKQLRAKIAELRARG